MAWKGTGLKQAMMSGRVQGSYSRVASMLGIGGQQYRPANPLAPMSAVYAQPDLIFDPSSKFSLSRPPLWGSSVIFVMSSLSGDTVVGDILVCGGQTCFVSAVQDFRPVEGVLCNRTVSISGATGSQAQIVAQCPAAILLHSRGDPSGSGVPGASRPGQFLMYLPLLPGVILTPYMTVTNDLGATYTINAVEQSGFGIRVTMSMQQV